MIAVSGSGRCGSSLVLQMLDAVGVPTLSEHRISFEAPKWNQRYMKKPKEALREVGDRAVKLLCPMLEPKTFPYGMEVDWLWCQRDPEQQAESQRKFARAFLAIDANPTLLVRQIKLEREEMHMLISQEPRQRIFHVQFERLIENPFIVSEQIIRFLKLDASARDMGRVVRLRDPSNFPGFLEMDMMEEELRAADQPGSR